MQSVAATVQSNICPGGHGFPKAGGDSSNELRCAALEFCFMPKGNLESIVSTCICINCNFTTHIECANHLFVQKSRKDGPIDYRRNLSIDGKARLVKWRGDRDDIMICLSCISNIKTRLQDKAGGAPLKRPKKQTYEKFVCKAACFIHAVDMWDEYSEVSEKGDVVGATVVAKDDSGRRYQVHCWILVGK